jgi:hypothetical protein
MNLEQGLAFLLGSVIIGEAVLLFIGRYIMGGKESAWKTRFNMNTLLIDIAFGLIILFHAFEDMPFIAIAIPALIITHLFREIEYFKKDKKSRFLTNTSLFIVNSIKLVGLLGLLFLLL